MTSSSPRIFAILMILAVPSLPAAESLAEWVAAEARGTDPVIVPEKNGGPALSGPGGGISIENDADHGKVLKFDGSQTGALSTGEPVPTSPNVRVSAKVRLGEAPAWGTIVRLADIELRHVGNRGNVALIVWTQELEPGESTPEISLPVRPGEWLDITGTVEGNTMRLSVNGEEIAREFTGQYQAKAGKVHAGLGAGRPLIGEIAGIKIEQLD